MWFRIELQTKIQFPSIRAFRVGERQMTLSSTFACHNSEVAGATKYGDTTNHSKVKSPKRKIYLSIFLLKYTDGCTVVVTLKIAKWL